MLALPVAELPVAGTSLEPFISALYFAFAANDEGPVIASIPAASVNARPARIIACRIAALLSKIPGTRETPSDPGLFRPWRGCASQDFGRRHETSGSDLKESHSCCTDSGGRWGRSWPDRASLWGRA